MSRNLGAVNWVVIIFYLLLIVGVGVFTRWKQKASKDEYLKGDGKVPSLVLAVSIWATTLSAITFVAFTATVYKLDWRYWIGMITIFALMPFVIKFIVPFFRKVKAITAYEYLEHRFSKALRVTASIIFILFHIGRSAIVVYIPTIALYAVTGLNPYVIAVVVGALTVLYTTMGGLKGVIWTDFIQGCVFLIGIVLTIFLAVNATVGSFGSIMKDANNAGHIFAKGSFASTLAVGGIPLIFFGQLFNNVYQYVGSQDVAQRYNGSEIKKVNRALLINGVLAVVGTALLAIIGTLMWSFYKGPHSAQNLSNLGLTINQVPTPGGKDAYPMFALDVLPVGISGLVIASILAASQSTVSSSISAIVSCISVDILPSIKKWHAKVKNELTFAKITTVVAGTLGVLLSVVLIAIKQDNLFNYWLGILGLFGTPVSVVFILGIFTKKSNNIGAWSGLGTAFIISLICWIYAQVKPDGQTINSLWFPIFSMPAGLFVGYVVSLLTPKNNENLKEILPLTIYGRKLEYVKKQSKERNVVNKI